MDDFEVLVLGLHLVEFFSEGDVVFCFVSVDQGDFAWQF